MSEENPTPVKTVSKSTSIIRRRPGNGRESIGGIPTRYLQTGMILVSLIISGVVAYKVFWPKKKTANIDQQALLQQQYLEQQRQQQQPLPEELEQTPPILQHPYMPTFENGNGNGYGNGHGGNISERYPINNPNTNTNTNSPAISSWAEKMIQEEQMKRVPVYQDTGVSGMQQTPTSIAQTQSRNRENISVFQYRVPTAPQIGQPQQQPPQHQQHPQGSDIF